MEWNNISSTQLIEEYEKHPVLWYPKHPSHYSRNLKVEAWRTIATNLNQEMYEVKQKMNSLLGSFRRERSKSKRASPTGKNSYVSKWFAFERMQFLLDKERPTTNNDNTNSEAEESDTSESEAPAATYCEPKLEMEESVYLNLEAFQNNSQAVFNSESQDQFAVPIPQKENKLKRKLNSEHRRHILDDCSIYCQHVANKLRTYNEITRSQVEHAINNILYEADMGKFDLFGSNIQSSNNSITCNSSPGFTVTFHNNTSQSSPVPTNTNGIANEIPSTSNSSSTNNT